jgi:hypothetical protein
MTVTNAFLQPFGTAFVAIDGRAEAMMITVLAAAMTVLMLIATCVGLHQEAVRVRLDKRQKHTKGFGWD